MLTALDDSLCVRFPGKTLVAEVLLLRRVIREKRKAIVVVPFVSLAREKTLYLQVGQAARCTEGAVCYTMHANGCTRFTVC